MAEEDDNCVEHFHSQTPPYSPVPPVLLPFLFPTIFLFPHIFFHCYLVVRHMCSKDAFGHLGDVSLTWFIVTGCNEAVFFGGKDHSFPDKTRPHARYCTLPTLLEVIDPFWSHMATLYMPACSSGSHWVRRSHTAIMIGDTHSRCVYHWRESMLESATTSRDSTHTVDARVERT